MRPLEFVYKGVRLTLDTKSFNPTQPFILLNDEAEESYLLNVTNLSEEWATKPVVIRKLGKLASPYGVIQLIVTGLTKPWKLTGRKATLHGVEFQEGVFDIGNDVVGAWMPVGDVEQQVPVQTYTVDVKHPRLYGKLLGRTFVHVKTTDSFRFIYA